MLHLRFDPTPHVEGVNADGKVVILGDLDAVLEGPEQGEVRLLMVSGNQIRVLATVAEALEVFERLRDLKLPS